jgi:hypothetical protein
MELEAATKFCAAESKGVEIDKCLCIEPPPALRFQCAGPIGRDPYKFDPSDWSNAYRTARTQKHWWNAWQAAVPASAAVGLGVCFLTRKRFLARKRNRSV